GRRLLATPVGGGAGCAGRHHVLFDDAAFGSASFQRRKVDSHLGGQALGQGRSLDPAIVLTILSSLLTRGWRRRRRALTRGRGLLRGLLPFWHRRRGLGFFRLCLSLLLGGRGGFGRWSFLYLLATVTDLGDRCPDLGRHALLDQDLQHPVGLRLEVEGRLVGFHLGQHLAGLDGVAALFLPLDDRALLHRLGELGHIYVRHCLLRPSPWPSPHMGRGICGLTCPSCPAPSGRFA